MTQERLSIHIFNFKKFFFIISFTFYALRHTLLGYVPNGWDCYTYGSYVHIWNMNYTLFYDLRDSLFAYGYVLHNYNIRVEIHTSYFC